MDIRQWQWIAFGLSLLPTFICVGVVLALWLRSELKGRRRDMATFSDLFKRVLDAQAKERAKLIEERDAALADAPTQEAKDGLNTEATRLGVPTE